MDEIHEIENKITRRMPWFIAGTTYSTAETYRCDNKDISVPKGLCKFHLFSLRMRLQKYPRRASLSTLKTYKLK